MPATTSLTGNPQELQPGYNPSVYYFKSSNSAQPGFRLYIEMFDLAGNVIATFRIAMAPGTAGPIANTGVLDITKIIRNYLSSDYNTSSVQLTPNSWFGYLLKVYEEYSSPLAYTNFLQFGATNNTYLAVLASPFLPGDQIVVSQSAGYVNPSINGVHTVLAGSDATHIVIDVAWNTLLLTGTHTGTTIYANGQLTRTFQFNTNKFYVWNGSLSFVAFSKYQNLNQETLYKMTTPGTLPAPLFLTSRPRTNFYIYDTQDIRLNFANFLTANVRNLDIKTSLGEHYTMGGAGIPVVSTQAVIGVNVGPSALTALNGVTPFGGSTFPVVKPKTDWYTVQVITTGGSAVSEVMKFYIDRRCRINTYEILFMDRMGSMLSYSFELRGNITNKNTKNTFKKLAGTLTTPSIGSTGYGYDTRDQGEKTYNVDFSQTLDLNTNWLNDEMSVYFQELVSSPVTYLKLETGEYVSVIVTDTLSVEKRQKNERLIKYAINVKFANAQNINI